MSTIRSVTTAGGELIYDVANLEEHSPLYKLLTSREDAKCAAVALFAYSTQCGLVDEMVQQVGGNNTTELRMKSFEKVNDFFYSSTHLSDVISQGLPKNENDSAASSGLCHVCGIDCYGFVWSNFDHERAAGVPKMLMCAKCNEQHPGVNCRAYRFEDATLGFYMVAFSKTSPYMPAFMPEKNLPEVREVDPEFLASLDKIWPDLDEHNMGAACVAWTTQALKVGGLGASFQRALEYQAKNDKAREKIVGKVHHITHELTREYPTFTGDVFNETFENVICKLQPPVPIEESIVQPGIVFNTPMQHLDHDNFQKRVVKVHSEINPSWIGKSKAFVVMLMQGIVSLFPNKDGYERAQEKSVMLFAALSSKTSRPVIVAQTKCHNDMTPGPNLLYAVHKEDRKNKEICAIWLVFLAFDKGIWGRIELAVKNDSEMGKAFPKGINFRPVPQDEGTRFITRGGVPTKFDFPVLTAEHLVQLQRLCPLDVVLIGQKHGQLVTTTAGLPHIVVNVRANVKAAHDTNDLDNLISSVVFQRRLNSEFFGPRSPEDYMNAIRRSMGLFSEKLLPYM